MLQPILESASMNETEIYDCAEVLMQHSSMIGRALHDGSFGLGGGPFNAQENASIHALVCLGSVIDSGWVIRPNFERVLKEELAARDPDTPSIAMYQRVMMRHEEWMELEKSLAPWRAEAYRIRSQR
jgi:hypothetical protein